MVLTHPYGDLERKVRQVCLIWCRSLPGPSPSAGTALYAERYLKGPE